MLTAIALVLLPQRLDPPKDVAHPGDPVKVAAIDQAGRPLGGVSVQIIKPSGQVVETVADAEGKVLFIPDEVGVFEFRMQVPDGPQVISVYRVVPRPRRWLHVAILTPLGLLLVYMNLRRLRH
jgi:hypothetical protein